MFFRFVTMHACDGQNYNPQDRASIAASRGKNRQTWHHLCQHFIRILYIANVAILASSRNVCTDLFIKQDYIIWTPEMWLIQPETHS